MAQFRRDGSRLESARGPQYRGHLLPWEQQLCETLSISTDEYFEYFDLVTQHIEEEKGRELIPDIRNEPTAIITLVVGLALSAVGALLAPKPKAPKQEKQGDPFQSSDVRGRTKFAPLTEFDSIQELATLGSLVPLIYTRQEDGHGGVRAESQLLWSRMRNNFTYQELRALLLFSAGEIDTDPEYIGYAFGDSRLSGYSAPKISLWFNRGLDRDSGNNAFSSGNKPFANDDRFQYSEGTRKTGSAGVKPFFSDVPNDGNPDRMLFCGTVTPSQAVQFGQYSPVRNGHGWKYDFKWPGKGDGDRDQKELIYGTRRKHVAGYHAGETTLDIRDGGKTLVYRIRDNDSDKIFQACKDDASNPKRRVKSHFDSSGKLDVESYVREGSSTAKKIGGLSEGINAIEQSKVDADSILDPGEMYLIGTDIYTCTDRQNEKGEPGTPYESRKSGSVEYTFKRENEFKLGYVDDKYIRVEDSEDVYNEKHMPIQKVAIGAVSTTRPVDMVEIGFKSTVYRQVNGYPNVNEFTSSDIADDFAKEGQGFQLGTMNSYYPRASLFRIEIKKGNGDWYNWNNDNLFVVYGTNPQPQYNQITIRLPEKDFYEFRFIPVAGNAWIANGLMSDKDTYLLNGRKQNRLFVGERRDYRIYINGEKIDGVDEAFQQSPFIFATGESDQPNLNPNALLNDFWYYSSDSASNENEPEHKITWINEYVENNDTWYDHEDRQYEHLAHAGLICRSSKEVSTFSNFSAYFTQGIRVKKFVKSTARPEGASNNFPEIAYDLLTNRRYGIGEYIGKNALDEDAFDVAADFCDANDFYWDGVISSGVNVREFLFQQAAYQMLDFTIKGGLFGLYPTVPFDSNKKISFSAKAGDSNFLIKALFTNSNVKDFKTTFLSPEERQMFTAELKYRKEEKNGFPETHVTRIRLADDEGGYDRDPIEAFDLTLFCTSRDQAIAFGKFALRIRKEVDHSVSFETTPDAAHNLSPGDYIRLGISIQHQERENGYTDRLRTGSTAPNGTVQTNEGIDLTSSDIEVYYWQPGLDNVRTGTLRIRDGVAIDNAMRGIIFTRKRDNSEARIYKIESIAYSEESFVSISATYTPLTKDGRMKVLQWDDSDFVIEDQQS